MKNLNKTSGDVIISFPVIEIHGNAKSRGVGGKDLGLPARSPASRSLAEGGRFGEGRAAPLRLRIDSRRSKTNKNLIFIDYESFP